MPKVAKADYTIHSKSLFNITKSPGWTPEETSVLRLAVMKFGIGKWKRIVDLALLPGKTIAQMNLQTQRIMGQQQMGGFMNLRIDPNKVRKDNEERINNDKTLKLKTGLIINTGHNPTKESRKALINSNMEKYGITEAQSREIVDQESLFQVKRQRRLQAVENHNKHKDKTTTDTLEIKNTDDMEDKEIMHTLKSLNSRLKRLVNLLHSSEGEKEKYITNEQCMDLSVSIEEEPTTEPITKKPTTSKTTQKPTAAKKTNSKLPSSQQTRKSRSDNTTSSESVYTNKPPMATGNSVKSTQKLCETTTSRKTEKVVTKPYYAPIPRPQTRSSLAKKPAAVQKPEDDEEFARRLQAMYDVIEGDADLEDDESTFGNGISNIEYLGAVDSDQNDTDNDDDEYDFDEDMSSKTGKRKAPVSSKKVTKKQKL